MLVVQKVSKQEAENILSSQRRFFPLISRKNKVVPDRIELIHLPFYVFDVNVESEGQRQKVSLSVDGLVGNAVFFTKDDMDIENMENLSSCDFVLSSSEAEDIILDEYKRLLLEIGDIAECEKVLKKAPAFSSGNLTIAGSDGRTACFELVSGGFRVVHDDATGDRSSLPVRKLCSKSPGDESLMHRGLQRADALPGLRAH